MDPLFRSTTFPHPRSNPNNNQTFLIENQNPRYNKKPICRKCRSVEVEDKKLLRSRIARKKVSARSKKINFSTRNQTINWEILNLIGIALWKIWDSAPEKYKASSQSVTSRKASSTNKWHAQYTQERLQLFNLTSMMYIFDP